MDFEFSDDQELLRGSLRRFLADHAPITPVVRGAIHGVGTDRGQWQRLAGLGAVGVLVPEAHGGAGGTMVDAAVVLEELGRALHPGAFVASAIGAVSLVLLAGSEADAAMLLPGLADGSVLGTVAWCEPGRRYDWRAPGTVAVRQPDGAYRLDGAKAHVPAATEADLLMVVAATNDGIGVFAVERASAGVAAQATESVDGTRKEGAVTFDGAIACRVGAGDATDAVAHALDRMTVATMVDAVGAASRALELSVDYAKARVAFGSPIGAFQAVQHLCADMLRAVELGRASAYYACWADGGADDRERHRAALMTHAYVAEALPQVGATAIQVFAGIGFTWEHDIHLFYKRLLSAGYAFGTADDARRELGDLVL